MNTNKQKRKEYVKEQRTKFKKDPTKFIQTEMVEPMLRHWREAPLHALATFIGWAMVFYLSFGAIQAINNDMIYCDSSIDQFDGKLMQTYNSFVEYYNEEARYMEQNVYPLSVQDQEEKVKIFNEQYTMICTYDLKRWWKEPIIYKAQTTWNGFLKILFKQS